MIQDIVWVMMQARVRDAGWRLTDELWAKMEPLLPPRPTHPLGCHRSRVPARWTRSSLCYGRGASGTPERYWHLLVLCGAAALPRVAGVFEAFWRTGLLAYDDLAGIDWTRLAQWVRRPWAGGKTGPNPTDRGKRATKLSLLTDGRGLPLCVIVERTHSWLNRFRRILIGWDKKPRNYLAMLHFAFGLIAWRSSSLPG